jgi:hypothetical protein
VGELRGTRARIVEYVREQDARTGTAPRMASIMKDLKLSTGSAGGHLFWLVKHGYLERPERGVYIIPGTSPKLPPPPSLSGAVSKRNVTVWAELSANERKRRVAALTRGRQEAAQLRREAGRS